jgi:hypothetical protein
MRGGRRRLRRRRRIAESWIALTQPGSQSLTILTAGVGPSLSMIGPGAWSIDAQHYGRKQIIPPEL